MADGVNDILYEQAKKLAEKKVFSDKTYKDEPLLFRASRLIEENEVPEAYREMYKLSSDPRFGYSEAPRFYAQAKLMEDFEEDESYEFRGGYKSVYPCYSRMNISQLRGYFSWRTRVRHGRTERTEYAFVNIYISELINLIGVKDADEGFEKLTSFLTEYSSFDSYILFQGLRWVKNYAIYYGIKPELYMNFARSLSGQTQTGKIEEYISTLIDFRSRGTEEIFEALSGLSSYNIGKSRWYKKDPAEAQEIICRVYASLYEKYEGKKTGLIRLLFPFIRETAYTMTLNNLFYPQGEHPDCVYRLSPLEIYECRGGAWTCTNASLYSNDFRCPDIGILLKATDCAAREIYGITPAVQKPPVREAWYKLITSEIGKYNTEKAERVKKRRLNEVKIDVSLLSSIRSDSDETREKLMTDEERGAEEPVVPASAAAQTSPEKTAVFTPGQIEFLKLVLEGGDQRAYAKAHGKFVSGLCDEINEAALEEVGDNVLDCDGDRASVIEDYIEEVKGIAGI